MSQSIFESDPALERQYAAVRQALAEPPRKRSNLLLVSLLLFVASQLMRGSASSVLMLLVVVTFHELGHYVGMRIFDYRDIKMFFIPMFGGAVSGKQQQVATWREGIVLLLGPMPGILVAFLVACSPYATSAWGGPLILNLAAINGFNLLPLGFLDGGRLWQCVLTSRSRALDLGFFLVTTLLLAALAWKIHATILVAVTLGVLVLSLVSIRQRWQIAEVARELPAPKGTIEPLNHDTAYTRDLYLSARHLLDVSQGENVPLIASKMEAIQSASRTAPTLGKSFGLLAVWFVGLLTSLGAIFVSVGDGTLAFHAQKLVTVGLAVDMPPKPLPFKPASVGSQLVALEGYKHGSFRRSYTAATWKVVDSATVSREWITTALLHLVRNVRDTNFEATASVPSRAGMDGAELTATIKDQHCRIRVYVSNDFAVQLTACWKKEDPQINQFLDSLRPEAGSSK